MNPGRLVILVVFMCGFALAVYLGIASLRHHPPVVVMAPAKVAVATPVAGTMYLTQNGGLYRLQGSRFTELLPAGGGWTQPVISPDHSSLAIVKRSSDWSDIWIADLDGHPVRQLTRNQGGDVASDHWAFYPDFSGDGATVFFSLDNPKDGYRVDLAIWALSAAGGSQQRWTLPNPYTGGDVSPRQVDGRTILFSHFGFDTQSRIHSQLVIQSAPFGGPRALTPPEVDCGQPAISPDHSRVAMICTAGQQTSRLVVAALDGSELGPPEVLVDGQLCTTPTWEPDGAGLAYLAPASASGKFQLWYVQAPAAGQPIHKPLQLTTTLDFDASSRIAWF